MRQIDEIIVHCTATRPEWFAGRSAAAKVDEIRRWHVEDRGWKDIGYAMLIDRDGTTAKGRDLDNDGDVFDDIGAHAAGHNSRSIGIVLVGGHGARADDKFLDNFTPEQDAALRQLINDIRTRFPSIKKVSGHNEYSTKACPGFHVGGWLSSLPAAGATAARPEAAPTDGLLAALLKVLAALFGGKK